MIAIESSEQIGTISWKTDAHKSMQLLTIIDSNDYYYILPAFKAGVKQRNWTSTLLVVYRIHLIFAVISSLQQTFYKRLVGVIFFCIKMFLIHVSPPPPPVKFILIAQVFKVMMGSYGRLIFEEKIKSDCSPR